jgi:DNA-binding beta-propeller fold protein YncE
LLATGFAALLCVLVACSVPDRRDSKATAAQSRDPALDPTCGASLNLQPGGAIQRIADTSGQATHIFNVSLDPAAPILVRQVNVPADDPDAGLVEQQPQFGAAKVSGALDGLSADVAIKRPSRRPDLLWLEWFLINDTDEGLRNLELELLDLGPGYVVYDLSTDLWAPALDAPQLFVGGVAPEGVSRFVMGIGTADGSAWTEAAGSRIEFRLQLRGQRTRFAAANTQALAVTPDAAEVWVPYADGNRVVVVDTQRRSRVAELAVPGAPQGMVITPDGRYAVTVAPRCNQVVVMDRARRQVVQRFGEADGVGREPRYLVMSPDGSRLYVSSYVGDSITAFDYREQGFSRAATFSVGRRPSALSVSPDGQSIYVAHFLPRGPMRANEAWISVHSAKDFSLLTDQATVVDTGNPEKAACTQLQPFFARWNPEQLQMEAPFTALQGAFLNPQGTEALVPSSVIVPFLIFEGDMRKAGLNRNLGRITTSNILPFDTRWPERTRIRQLDTLLEVRDRDLEYQRCFNRNANAEFPNSYPQAPERPGILTSNGATLPTGETGIFQTGQIRSLAHTRGGRRTIYVSYTSDELVVLDGATRNSVARRHHELSGHNPLGIALTPDGRIGYVAYDNSPFLSVIDTSAYARDGDLPRPGYVPFWLSKKRFPQASASNVTTTRVTRDIRAVPRYPALREIGQIPLVDADPVDPVMRRGRILFSSANPDKLPQLSSHREGSCNNCHPRGGMDGSMWVTVEGERRTPSLRGGVGGRGWLHASATHHDAHEFVAVVHRERLGGTGLGEPDLDAMARYVAWGIPRLQAPVTDPALVARGETLFTEYCAECHLSSAQELQASASAAKPYGGANGEPRLHGVGTRTDYAGASMGDAFLSLFGADPIQGPVFKAVVGDRAFTADDVVFNYLKATPRPERPAGKFKAASLVNVWDNALFFHNGQFHELRDAVAYMAEVNYLPLTDADIDAVIEYLRTF